jgi:hypothetical protein
MTVFCLFTFSASRSELISSWEKNKLKLGRPLKKEKATTTTTVYSFAVGAWGIFALGKKISSEEPKWNWKLVKFWKLKPHLCRRHTWM